MGNSVVAVRSAAEVASNPQVVEVAAVNEVITLAPGQVKEVHVNGQRAKPSVDYIVSGSSLIWQSNSYDLQPGFTVVIN